jgi:murein L,D-transpeptidase YafK
MFFHISKICLLLIFAHSSFLMAAADGPVVSSGQEMIFLTVDKSRNQADLKTLPENGLPSETLKTFKIATGKVEGDKEKQGDHKTPEGIYFTTGTIPSEQLAPQKYGPLAIPLNFPNPMDRAAGKTGYGIWLHGVGDRRIEDARVTEGCVAFLNSEITRLTKWLLPGQGVVVIAKDASEVNRLEDVQAVIQMTKNWVTDWAARDISAYINHYADDFNHQGKTRSNYESYKRSVFGSYKKMTVQMDNLRIVTHPKYAVAMMNQVFSGDNRFKSDGRKLIYLRREVDGSWRIVRELFDNFMMRPVQFSNEDVAVLNRGAAILQPEKGVTASSAVPADNQSL